MDDDVIQDQYKAFIVRLNTLCKDVPESDLKSMNILTQFYRTSTSLYEGIELIMHIMNVAAVSMGVESILESQISVYEKHADGCRNLGEDRGCHEMHVSLNGPPLNKKRSVVVNALDAYFKDDKKKLKGWHFIRRTTTSKNYLVSQVVDKLGKKVSSLPFMD